MSKNHMVEKNDISILIIEDEAVLALGLEATLKSFGYSVCGIENNLQSIVKNLSIYSPDLVLADIKLNGVSNGIQISKYIWQTKKIPIVFLTSYCDEKTIKETMCCEPYGYLVKPCKDKELNAVIQTAINKHKYFFGNKEVLSDDNIVFLIDDFKYHRGKSILYKKETPIKLTGNETKLFDLLSDSSQEVVSFERISSYIWRESLYDLGKLRTMIYRLKQKLDADIVESVFEMGYRLKSN